jgi:inhibitor of cysteine peptidase
MLLVTAGLLLAFAGSSLAAIQGSGATWSIEARVALPAQEVAALGAAGARAELVDPIVAAMGAKGVAVEVQEVSGQGATSYALNMTASGTVDDFRRQFHTVILPELRALGGATEMRISSGMQSLTSDMVIAATPSTGYLWTVANDSEFTEGAPTDFVMHTRGAGVPQHQILHLRNASQRAGSIKLVYHRPWERAETTMRVTLALDSLPQRLDLSDPTVPSGPVAPPAEGTVDASAFPAVKASALPAALDWRDSGIVTPVRDQGGCGSCWAFGTVGVMESALWKSGTANVNLSEQFLVSCNQSGWSCSGGLTAHKYHFDTLGRNQTEIGAVLESAKPYTASNGTCTTALSHPYRLSGWQFIVPSEFAMPTVDQIKAAIQTYGPITAGVCAGSGWDTYTGGIFSTEESASACGGSTNHQIVLVGWNDNGGNGYWILRNSWGSGWGESGYMRIAYGTSRVGEGTSWVATSASGSTITVTSPNGGETLFRGSVVPIRWSSTGTPGDYVKIELYNGAILSSTITPSTSRSAGSYNWTIPSTQATGSNFTIKVTSTSNSAISDASNAPFTIAAPSITVTSPNGGETLSRGSVVPIKWSYAGNPGANVKIELYNGTILNRTITSSTSLGTGSFNWTIPSTQALGSNFKIKITSTTNSAISDTSNAAFTIATPSITVISPNGGESFTRGTVLPITWKYVGNPGANVKILLYKGLFLNRTIITSTPLSAGSYKWTIPSTQAAGTSYKIKVISTTNSLMGDAGNGAFTIK